MIKEFLIACVGCAIMIAVIVVSEPEQKEVLKPVVNSITKVYPTGTFEHEVKRTE